MTHPLVICIEYVYLSIMKTNASTELEEKVYVPDDFLFDGVFCFAVYMENLNARFLVSLIRFCFVP